MEADLHYDSWHQRLNTWSIEETYNPMSLCPYWWTTIWNIAVAVPRYILRKLWAGFVYCFFYTGVPDAIENAVEKIPFTVIGKWIERNDTIIGHSVLWLLGGYILLLFGYIAIVDFAGFLKIMLAVLLFILWIGETDAWRMVAGMYLSAKKKVCPAINWS